MTNRLFVYGTLKRGECRESMWPRRPLAVRVAYVLGSLYDLGEYPGLWCGDEQPDEWVAGELWTIADDDLDVTLRVLDEIEQTDQPGCVNLYDRILVRAHFAPLCFPGAHIASPASESELAHAYQYSTGARLPASRRIESTGQPRIAIWRSQTG